MTDSHNRGDGGEPRRNRLRRLGLPAAVLAIAIGVSALTDTDSNNRQAKPLPGTGKSTGPRSVGPAVVQAASKPATFRGETCYSQTHTIQDGDTIFNLSAAGLRKNPYFMNAVFRWNLSYVQEQAEKNPALADPNNLKPGTKVKLYGDCVQYQPVWKHYKYDPNDLTAKPTPEGYRRVLTYQNYQGTDSQIHHLVTIDYRSTAEGELSTVASCEPTPDCYDYVVGAPENPPRDPFFS